MKSINSLNRMLAQYLQKTNLPITLFWMSSALLLPQAAGAQEESFEMEAVAVEETLYPEAQDPVETVDAEAPIETTNTALKTPTASAMQAHKPGESCGVGCDQKPSGYCAVPLKARVTCCPPDRRDECGKLLPHQNTCCCCNCINATAPLENLGFMIDLLYFKPIEDSLVYAITNTFTMGPPSSPPGQLINQKYGYRPGARAALLIPLDYDEWEFDIVYTYFHSNAPTTVAKDPNQFLFSTLTAAVFPLANNALNSQCGYVNGSWKLKMDFVDLEFKRPFLVGKSLMVSPLLGIKAGLIRQNVHVSYQNIYGNYYGVTTPVLAPQTVIGKSKVWGVGPELGTEMKFLIPRNFSLFMKGAFSCMLGQYNMTSKYTDFLAYFSNGATPPVLTLGGQTGASIIRDKITRLFCVGQLQGAISKWWMLGRCSSLELMLGWETQIWWRQMRMNWFSSLTVPQDGSDLTLQGPFARATFTF